MKKLFLLDAFALIYRAHFAFIKNPRMNSKGLNTSCIFGFTNSLLEIINKEKPSHIGVAFDTPEPTFRHLRYQEYKANREAQPEDITLGVPYIIKMLEAFNIPVLSLPGYEADDVIGTIAKKTASPELKVYMMTSDKDYCQLVDENIYLYRPASRFKKTEILGIQEVLEKFNIKNTEQVIDILGLQGDAVDNIPGIPGVGEKTAIKLIEEYGNIEKLIENAGQLKGKLKENILTFAQQGLLSKELATIKIDVPIPFEISQLEYEAPDKEKIAALFDELEFRNLKTRVLGNEENKEYPTQKNPRKNTSGEQLGLFGTSAPDEETLELQAIEKKNIHNTFHKYHLIDTPALRQELIKYLKLQEEFCFDTETTHIDPLQAELVGIAFSYYPKEAYYVPIPAERAEAEKIVEEFKEVFENSSIQKIGQNIKYDLIMLGNYKVQLKGPLFDTMIAHFLIDPSTRHNMDAMSENYLNYVPVSISELIGKKKGQQGNMRDVAIQKVVEYAGEDADITLQLKHHLAPFLKKEGTERIFQSIENPLIPVLAQMEKNGVRLDTDALANYSAQLQSEIITLEEQIYQAAGEKFNIASPKQLGEILFDKMSLIKQAKKTKSGQYATGEEVLIRLANEHSIVKDILNYRELQKLKNTYVDTLPQLLHPEDHKIHTSFNQAIAVTGRLSSTNPNLQNIPIKTAKGREVRKAFIPSDQEHLILSADYSQIELRLMASFSQDATLIKAFKEQKDIHSITASKIYQVEVDQVDREMRRKAKTANFGIIYGISSFGLSQRLNIPRTEASSLIRSYFEQFPSVKKYMDEIIMKAREYEYVETLMGRKRYLPDINSRNATTRGFAERNAINTPIQGSAADMIKLAMIKIHEWMQEAKLQSKMILQVHDELVFDAHKEELDLLSRNVKKIMCEALPIDVPLEVEVGIGENWLEAH